VLARWDVSTLFGPGEDSIQSCVLSCDVEKVTSEDVQLAEECVLVDTSRLAGNLALVDKMEVQGKYPRVKVGERERLLLEVRNDGIFEKGRPRGEKIGMDAECPCAVSFADDDGEDVRAEAVKKGLVL
jgi:hypothetical protein